MAPATPLLAILVGLLDPVVAPDGGPTAAVAPPADADVTQRAPDGPEPEQPASRPRQEVQLSGGMFEVLLSRPVPSDAAPWLWLDSGRQDGNGKVQPVPPQRSFLVTLEPCDEGAHPERGPQCARATGLDDLSAEPGRYQATLNVRPGQSEAITLYVPPNPKWLWISLLAGLAISFAVTTLAERILDRLQRRRRLHTLEARVRSSREDHPPLLARIKGLLELVRLGLARPIFGADPVALDGYLDEAEQLLRLAEAKMRIWQRARALHIPPTLSAQINAELRLFDAEVLQLNLPLKPDAFEALHLHCLDRATELMENAGLSFQKDLAGALADGRADALPAPALAPDGGVPTLGGELQALVDREQARLGQLAAVADEARSPLQLREADLRLSIVRATREVLAHGAEAVAALDADLVRRALAQWRTIQDFTQSAADRAFEAVLYALRWQPENARFQHWLEDFLRRGSLSIAADATWQTFTACPVRVDLQAAVGTRYTDSYLWRRLIEVGWRATDATGRPTDAVTVIGDPAEDGWVTVQGPETSAYCTRPGFYRLEARIQPPEGGATRAVPQGLAVRALPGPEHRLSVVMSVLSDVRLSLKLLAALIAGLVLMDEARRDPHGFTTYTGLFYAAIGAAIDLGTTALPRGVEAATAALRGVLSGRRNEPADD
jgi:hypothetical protein